MTVKSLVSPAVNASRLGCSGTYVVTGTDVVTGADSEISGLLSSAGATIVVVGLQAVELTTKATTKSC